MMSYMIRAIVLAAMLVAIPLAPPAHADSATPTLYHPPSRIGGTADVELMIEAPARAWGIRRSAKHYDAHIDGLTIHTRGSCAERPLAICVRVHIASFSDEEMLTISHGLAPYWNGLVNYDLAIEREFDIATSPRSIYLNTRSVPGGPTGALIARHELGHVLGLDHHSAKVGVMVGASGGGTMWPSTAEIATLQAWYAQPAL